MVVELDSKPWYIIRKLYNHGYISLSLLDSSFSFINWGAGGSKGDKAVTCEGSL